MSKSVELIDRTGKLKVHLLLNVRHMSLKGGMIIFSPNPFGPRDGTFLGCFMVPSADMLVKPISDECDLEPQTVVVDLDTGFQGIATHEDVALIKQHMKAWHVSALKAAEDAEDDDQ